MEYLDIFADDGGYRVAVCIRFGEPVIDLSPWFETETVAQKYKTLKRLQLEYQQKLDDSDEKYRSQEEIIEIRNKISALERKAEQLIKAY